MREVGKGIREVTLKQTGYMVGGDTVINLWGGGQGKVTIDETFIPLDKLSKENLLRCINDGRFGCESFDNADLYIDDMFENGYREFNRIILVDGLSFRQQYFCSGI